MSNINDREMVETNPLVSIRFFTSRSQYSIWHNFLAHSHGMVSSLNDQFSNKIANKLAHLLCILASHTYAHCTFTIESFHSTSLCAIASSLVKYTLHSLLHTITWNAHTLEESVSDSHMLFSSNSHLHDLVIFLT